MRRLILAVLAFVATAATAFVAAALDATALGAQSPDQPQGTGVLEGTVRDSTGHLLQGVLVAVERPVRAVLSDVGGRFRVEGLPPDTVIVSVQHAGFAPANF